MSISKKKQILEDIDFEKGEIVWAKLKGYPYWPSQIEFFNPSTKKFRVRFLKENSVSDLRAINLKKFKEYFVEMCTQRKMKNLIEAIYESFHYDPSLAAIYAAVEIKQQEKKSKQKGSKKNKKQNKSLTPEQIQDNLQDLVQIEQKDKLKKKIFFFIRESYQKSQVYLEEDTSKSRRELLVQEIIEDNLEEPLKIQQQVIETPSSPQPMPYLLLHEDVKLLNLEMDEKFFFKRKCLKMRSLVAKKISQEENLQSVNQDQLNAFSLMLTKILFSSAQKNLEEFQLKSKYLMKALSSDFSTIVDFVFENNIEGISKSFLQQNKGSITSKRLRKNYFELFF